MKRIVVLIICFLALSLVGLLEAYASSVLVSEGVPEGTHETIGENYYGHAKWSNMTTALDSATNYNVTVVSNFENLSQMLSYDALWLDLRWPNDLTDPPLVPLLSTTEIANISAFISTGRRVVMMGENSNNDFFRDWDTQILSITGGTVDNSVYIGNTSSSVSNILTHNVDSVYIHGGASASGGIALFDYNFATLWGDNVLTILDTNVFGNSWWDSEDNAQFAMNVSYWVANDDCPNDPEKTKPGICGCGIADTDTDNDGTPDCNDNCPNDPGKTIPGVCGCGISDIDSDGDGTPDCNDNCDNDPNKTQPGICGCGVADIDSDLDGIPNCNDNCPNDPNKTGPGICGCGIADTDSDGDGIPDCNDDCDNRIDSDGDGTNDCDDLCPKDPNKTQPGTCGCSIADTDSDNDGVLDCNDKLPAVNDYHGTYSGTYEGEYSGTWTAKVEADGHGVAFINSNKSDLPDVGYSRVDPGGELVLTMSESFAFATIDAKGNVAGWWESSLAPIAPGEPNDPTTGGTIKGTRNTFDGMEKMAGKYSGTYKGTDSGTWKATAIAEGSISGTTESDEYDFPDSGTGIFNAFGEIFMEMTRGAIMYGMLTSGTNTIQGVWHNPKTGDDGSLVGTKEVTADPAPSIATSDSSGGGGCFIATAAYGSIMELHVKILRDFRDRFMIGNTVGKIFVRFYYTYSPPFAYFIAEHDSLRAVVRVSLLPVVGVSWIALKLGPTSTMAVMLLFVSGFIGLVWFRRRYKE